MEKLKRVKISTITMGTVPNHEFIDNGMNVAKINFGATFYYNLDFGMEFCHTLNRRIISYRIYFFMDKKLWSH